MSTEIVIVWQLTVAFVTAAAIAVLMKLWFDWGDVIAAKAATSWNKLINALLEQDN
ncbi:MAG: hypothetical protein Q8L79_03170 [Methylobacter sp.]|uniref:hypothetical protein n=1 Tax=Methylobacter sp. TaxID=2051955 RepID=UPI002731F10A|nr:hypothetical protein [Methylobacter sp.]MDP1664102.1 hypothetical protein [Methylobacter sp.]